MKFLLLSALCLFSFNSFSNRKDHKEMDKKFEQMPLADAKKMKLEMLEKKSNMIEEERKCITAASDKDAFKGCMKKMWEDKKEMKKDMKKKM